MLIYEMLSIRRSNLSLQRSSHSPPHFSPPSHSPAMLDPIEKTTITRFVYTLAAVDSSYWEHNSDQLITIDPMSIVANFQFLLPTTTQRASDHTGNSTLEYSCDLSLGSLHPVVPQEVTADRWSTTSSLVFPSVDPLAVLAWNEETEVRLPQLRTSYN
jgi:hypothetical protein